MRIPPAVRAALFALLAAIVCLFAFEADADPMVPGPFTLKQTDGATVDGAELDGKPYGVMFGFTHCPDICPTALAELSTALAAAPDLRKDFRVYFVSVDPERDTPQALGAYVGAFDPRVVGLTGAPEDIATATQAFGAVARKVPTKSGGYTMDHTAALYLVDANGIIVDRVSFKEPADVMAKRIAAAAR
ncbi:SCO family protein [Methylopila sp. M107]|uniref:SCO family protein n=1 Tax=Methylopila sp. M107 TaxID=1101190 RepID=UPI00035D862B|nr:SCO family protein [Methylopila sp. M107]